MRFSPFLLLCATGFFAIFSSTISKSPVLPLFAAHLGADPSGVGLVAAVSAFTGVMFSIPAGIISDRFGKQKLLLFSSGIFLLAPFLYLGVTQLWQLAAVRFFHGFGTAIFVPVGMALVSEKYHKERGEKMGWFSTATLAGRFMAPVIGGGIISVLVFNPGQSYRVVYGVCGAAGLATLLLALFIPRSAERQQQSQSWAGMLTAFKTVLANRIILITCAVEAAILFAYGTFETFLPLYSVSIGISPYEVGIFLSAQVMTLAVSKPMMGRFSDRHGRRPQIFAGALLGAVCIGLFSLCKSFAPLLVLSIVFGLSLSIVTASSSAFIADLSSKEALGSSMGLLGSIMDIGHTAGPLFSGVVAAHFGYGKAFIGGALVLIVFAGVFLAGVGMGNGSRRTHHA
ncbi:MAG: MFS transporter [Thermodesulfovibrio sp.]|nr:MFS transporter [Thermodesulfovibrio sp.]